MPPDDDEVGLRGRRLPPRKAARPHEPQGRGRGHLGRSGGHQGSQRAFGRILPGRTSGSPRRIAAGRFARLVALIRAVLAPAPMTTGPGRAGDLAQRDVRGYGPVGDRGHRPVIPWLCATSTVAAGPVPARTPPTSMVVSSAPIVGSGAVGLVAATSMADGSAAACRAERSATECPATDCPAPSDPALEPAGSSASESSFSSAASGVVTLTGGPAARLDARRRRRGGSAASPAEPLIGRPRSAASSRCSVTLIRSQARSPVDPAPRRRADAR